MPLGLFLSLKIEILILNVNETIFESNGLMTDLILK